VLNPGPPNDGHLAGEFSVTTEEVTCQQFVELVTDYFEGDLPSRTLSKVEEHLVMCDWCVAYVGQMQATVDALRALKNRSTSEPSDFLLTALRAQGAAER
jgi:predicted anti-sigma-YlaC factor YlaD